MRNILLGKTAVIMDGFFAGSIGTIEKNDFVLPECVKKISNVEENHVAKYKIRLISQPKVTVSVDENNFKLVE